MSINFSFSEDFQSPSMKTFHELVTRNVSEQDFEGVVPGEKYWGLIKIAERGSVTLNLHGSPLSQLTNWTLSVRFKKAADGTTTDPKVGNGIMVGMLCQPAPDLPVDVPSSIGVIIVGTGQKLLTAVSDGTAENWKNIQFTSPDGIENYVPFTGGDPTQASSLSLPSMKIPSIQSIGSSVSGAASGAISSATGQATSALAGVQSAISGLTTSLGSSLTGTIAKLASNPAVNKVVSMLGGAIGPSISKIAKTTVADVNNASGSFTSSLDSAASAAHASIAQANAAASQAGGAATNLTKSISVSSPALSSSAAELSKTSAAVTPEGPSIKTSATSGPFFTVVLTYSNGTVNAVLDGKVLKTFTIAEEVAVALNNKPFIVGIRVGKTRAQVDNISFSGNG